MKQGKSDDGFRMSDTLWEQMKPLLPAPKSHPLGCHRLKLVAATLTGMMCGRPGDGRKSKLLLDLDYDYDEVRRIVDMAGFEPIILGRRDEQENKKQRGTRARRWVVERTHSWLNRFRRLLVRWKKRKDTYLAMLQFA